MPEGYRADFKESQAGASCRRVQRPRTDRHSEHHGQRNSNPNPPSRGSFGPDGNARLLPRFRIRADEQRADAQRHQHDPHRVDPCQERGKCPQGDGRFQRASHGLAAYIKENFQHHAHDDRVQPQEHRVNHGNLPRGEIRRRKPQHQHGRRKDEPHGGHGGSPNAPEFVAGVSDQVQHQRTGVKLHHCQRLADFLFGHPAPAQQQSLDLLQDRHPVGNRAYFQERKEYRQQPGMRVFVFHGILQLCRACR